MVRRFPQQMLYIERNAKVGEAVAKTADQVIAELEEKVKQNEAMFNRLPALLTSLIKGVQEKKLKIINFSEVGSKGRGKTTIEWVSLIAHQEEKDR